MGLDIDASRRHRVIGIEDSGVGDVSIRLAGFLAIGVEGGNIERSGSAPFLYRKVPSLLDALPLLLAEHA